MKNNRRLLTAALALVMGLPMAFKPSAAHERIHEVRGQVVRVTDGDTVTLLDASLTRITIRLAGIDAPESRMPYGHAAKEHLAGLVLNKEVVAVTQKQDRYRRTVATIWLNSENINLAMIQAGMAWHYKLYVHEQPRIQAENYANSELLARTEGSGLWRDENPVPPWLWRKSQILPAITPTHAQTVMLTGQRSHPLGRFIYDITHLP